jgi:hypothetical protein
LTLVFSLMYRTETAVNAAVSTDKVSLCGTDSEPCSNLFSFPDRGGELLIQGGPNRQPLADIAVVQGVQAYGTKCDINVLRETTFQHVAALVTLTRSPVLGQRSFSS